MRRSVPLLHMDQYMHVQHFEKNSYTYGGFQRIFGTCTDFLTQKSTWKISCFSIMNFCTRIFGACTEFLGLCRLLDPRPIYLDPFLPLSLSLFKFKIRNWIGKRKQTKWRVCGRYRISQLCLEGPTDTYVRFISKFYRKHCRMLEAVLPGFGTKKAVFSSVKSRI